MADSGVVEVRCERCQTSFAPEWKQCIHCGGPLGRGRMFRSMGQKEIAHEPEPPSSEALFEAHEEEEEGVDLQGRGRNLVWIFTALAFMLMSALRNCGAGSG